MERAGIDPVALARGLVDIDSTTGREGEAAAWLAGALGAIGFEISAQPVSGERFNVLATCGAPPQVVLSTHFDCVPPFFPSRLEGNRLYGRGSCDAKGILAAQVAAVDALRRGGERRVGLLFVVGEERGSDGARAANANAPASCRYLVDGEPTDNRLGVATRGIMRVRLKASGRAAHSSYPELGESAIDKLLDTLVEMRGLSWPSDPELGRTHYTIGLISGGIAPNVVSPSAEAEVNFRTVSDASAVREVISALEGKVTLEAIHAIPRVRMTTVPGFDTAVFPYATDIPFLDRWGQPLLYGPGSIHVAHTADEFIDLDELHAAVGGYQRIARELLARGD
jgi:acetylornithine deacetylase